MEVELLVSVPQLSSVEITRKSSVSSFKIKSIGHWKKNRRWNGFHWFPLYKDIHTLIYNSKKKKPSCTKHKFKIQFVCDVPMLTKCMNQRLSYEFGLSLNSELFLFNYFFFYSVLPWTYSTEKHQLDIPGGRSIECLRRRGKIFGNVSKVNRITEQEQNRVLAQPLSRRSTLAR
jgi:hypothetical protein